MTSANIKRTCSKYKVRRLQPTLKKGGGGLRPPPKWLSKTKIRSFEDDPNFKSAGLAFAVAAVLCQNLFSSRAPANPFRDLHGSGFLA